MAEYQAKTSFLVFDSKRKFLLYKILTKELQNHLLKEFDIYFSSAKLEDKTNQDTNQTLELESDLVYEYFAPIVNSFEISKDINFKFESTLLNNSNYSIRFYPFKEYLFICIYDLKYLNLTFKTTDLVNQVYSDYYSNWFCKSFLSLIIFKYGICLDKKCFDSNFKSLFLKWCDLFLTQHVYYVEAIEVVQVNEDIKNKCETFLDEFINNLSQTESILADFDYMDDEFSNNNVEEVSNEESNELENFFNDPSSVNLHILSCSGKILYKQNRLDKLSRKKKLSLDSSSVFLLLLESALFLETYSTEDLNDTFKTANNSSFVSMDSDNNNFMSVFEPDKNFVSTPQSIESSPGFDLKKNFITKTTSCFLSHKNQSLGFYDVLYLKLSDGLCLISVKLGKYSKYCDLIHDFENLLIDFNNILIQKIQNFDREENINKQFLSFFMNKLIIFYEKLINLKDELNSKNSIKKSNFLKKNFDENKSSRRTSIQMDPWKQNSLRIINTLQVKLNVFNNSQQFKDFISGTSKESDLRYLESQMDLIKSNLNDLFFELFLSNSKTTPKEILDKKLSMKSLFLLDNLANFYTKHLNDYKSFIDIKVKRNYSMAYYLHMIPGLVHFSFINRNNNKCIIPSMDSDNNIDEFKINKIYKKYLPIVYKLLYSNDSTEFIFRDDKLGVTFSYKIWFVDKNFNKIPVDFNEMNQLYGSITDVSANYQNSVLIKMLIEKNSYRQPGITGKNFYDFLKKVCYPNAPVGSLICYELATLHGNNVKEEIIKNNIKYLSDFLPKVT
ncbi:unnamed protein product [Brachionus calyciflorus]|uniref:Hermansky-Pudlak syndrome 1 n=1 Tax=Brachionus calyciflorus TaxID=104777 RepID=A0A813LWZ4_9BILA|nr:unnamed protein product [Brachionus calyciflorus]